MSTREKAIISILAIAILVAASSAAVLLNSNSQMNKNDETSSRRLQMNSILFEGQAAVQGEIEKVRNITINLALQLRETGLNGTMAREKINHSLELDPYIVDVLTYDVRGVVLAVEPERYRYIEGLDLSESIKTQEALTYKVPVMSDTFQAREGMRGAGYGTPVFDADGTYIGAVSLLFDVAALMNATLPGLTANTTFTWWSLQLDGTQIYDADVSAIGTNLLTGPEAVNNSWMRDLAWKLINETSGHTTYRYFNGEKECYWATIGAEGVHWRLVLATRV